EIFDLIRDINDPEHPYTLEQLNVVQEELIRVQKDAKHTYVDVRFTPTIPHCSMATLIGLAIRVKLARSLHPRIKVRVSITEGSHSTEEAINRQLADKERVAAAMENTSLMYAVNQCLAEPTCEDFDAICSEMKCIMRSNEFWAITCSPAQRFLSSKAKSNTKKYLQRQMKDEFAAKAREHSYRARSAFKLIEMDDRFNILRPGMTVLDVGCAPGSWCQVVVERCELNTKTSEGYLLGVDLQLVSPIPGADIMSSSDITSPSVQRTIAKKLNGRQVDVVLSDMAPNPTGDNATDHLRLVNLCRTVFHLFAPPQETSPESAQPRTSALFELSSEGMFICKLWDGTYRQSFMLELLKYFNQVRIFKPKSSRDSSAELYLVALAAGEAVAKALSRAIKQELQQSQHAAARHSAKTGQSASETRDNANANARLGISLEVVFCSSFVEL
ncbi:ribosomal RNA large subunit methyltransferase J, partial [Cooperia oncophora]